MIVRNPHYNAFGAIDCELQHPEYGWIPFTASPADEEQHGRELYARIIAGEFGAVATYVEPEPVPLTLGQVQELRRAAYVAESDPLKNEADYDAMLTGTEPDYTAWMAAVEAIKARYPLP